MREIDRRVRYLDKRLDELTVVDRPPTDTSRVFFAAWVTLLDEDDEERLYRIVGADELDVDKRYISLDSPLARALLKKSVGDEVEVRTPAGARVYEIIAIVYENP